MKISQEKRQENRKAIIAAAVDMICEKGLKGASMRAIARAAGVGDGTIYNYFPTKESILFGYYQDVMEEAAALVRRQSGFDEYDLQERVQAFFEDILERFLPDREFVEVSMKPVFVSMPPNMKELRPVQQPFFDFIGETIDNAVERGEIEEQVFRDMLVRFYWDHFLGLVYYWLRDSSEMFTDTTTLADKTLGLGAAALRAGMANRIFDVCSFLFRNHVLAYFEGTGNHMASFRQIGKAFMEGPDGNSGRGF